MKKIKIIGSIVTIVILMLLGFLGAHFLGKTNLQEKQPPKIDNKFLKIIFKIKNNLPLKRDILPKTILIDKANQLQLRERLVDVLFNFQVALHYFQPLAASKLTQVFHQDTIITLEPYDNEILIVEVSQLTVAYLRKIMKLEEIFLQNIIDILNNNKESDVRWQTLKIYLENNNLSKYFLVLTKIVWR